MMRAAILVRLLLLTLALIAATVAIGWWGIAIAAFAWGMWAGRPASRGEREPWNWTDRPTDGDEVARGAARSATIAAILAWSSILLWTAARGPLAALVTTLAQVARAPGPILILVTLLFPAVLAWSAATVGAAITARFSGAPAANRQTPTASARADT
jgi:hypothetical protein